MTQSFKQIISRWAPAILLTETTSSIWVSPDGEIERIPHDQTLSKIEEHTPLVCHLQATAFRLNCKQFLCFDILELYAFVRPAAFCVPTPNGLADAMDLQNPNNEVDAALILLDAAVELLKELTEFSNKEKLIPIAEVMGRGGWLWAPLIFDALGLKQDTTSTIKTNALNVWEDLLEWSEYAPEPPDSNNPITEEESISRLTEMLPESSELRHGQIEYTSQILPAFGSRNKKEDPHVVLANAGTGVGKTLGYLAPSTVWAEKNNTPVWVSTFTRNLQHQIASELNSLYPDPIRKSKKITIRKGRENYLCLLNLEEASRQLLSTPQHGVALGLMTRWISKTQDGDMTGGDFPSWLSDLLGRGKTIGLADRRGECIYSACPHYHKCFVEKSIRNSRRADIVIANHALVMAQSSRAEEGAPYQPTRFIFDEGHHLFEAADAAFSIYLSGAETFELRRWLLGTEKGTMGRGKGLKRRVIDLIADDSDGLKILDNILLAAHILPREGWLNRLLDQKPVGPGESFFSAVKQQVDARSEIATNGYSLETAMEPATETLIETATIFSKGLNSLVQLILQFCGTLSDLLDDKKETIETHNRIRIEAIIRSLTRRGSLNLKQWQSMLDSISNTGETEFIDWLEIERLQGHNIDIGMKRHWLDPTAPLMKNVFNPAHGIVITSATLREESIKPENQWEIAEKRTGTIHLKTPAIQVTVDSPFDYSKQTQVIIVNDVKRNDLDQVAAAYRDLFIAANGGSLGLFTAIRRLRAVHGKIFHPLDKLDLKVYSQHSDGLNLSTLIDIFRMEENSCLLGTDAARDGVDIPGRSLRLIVFDRVPWPRPAILNKARQELFGRKIYTDMLTKIKLTQAFGRLIRSKTDKGIFILLDPGMPTRLLTAFPKEAAITRCNLANAISEVKTFLNP